MSTRWPVIVLGGSGYVAGEMLRLVAMHPDLELAAAVSTSRAGQPVAGAFMHLAGAYPTQCFVGIDALERELRETGPDSGARHWAVLSAAPHGASAPLIARLLDTAGEAGLTLTVVDASADFRFRDAETFARVYGHAHPTPALLGQFSSAVPEHLGSIETPHAAHPGCFATTMLLGIVPLVAGGLIDGPVYVSAVTGSTGAGSTPRETTHHPVRQSNLFAYQPLMHRHVPEVEALTNAATGQDLELHFVPHSGPFARGIHATIFARKKGGIDRDGVLEALAEYYEGSRLVRVSETAPRMKDVAGSNLAALGVAVDADSIVVMSVLDNLLKGAASGAVQWLNRLLGLADDRGLDFPPAGWI